MTLLINNEILIKASIKKGCSRLTMMREYLSRRWKRSTLCDLIKRIIETGITDRRKIADNRDLQEWQQTFIELENCPPNSPDLNPMDYTVWGTLQQMVYHHTVSDIDQLKRVLIDCWAQLSQDILNPVIDQLPRRLMMVIKAKGAHGEFHVD